jgi:hypothetical protein
VPAAEGAQERLLERVFGVRAPETLREEAEDDVAMLDVEALEGWNGHCLHHR